MCVRRLGSGIVPGREEKELLQMILLTFDFQASRISYGGGLGACPDDVLFRLHAMFGFSRGNTIGYDGRTNGAGPNKRKPQERFNVVVVVVVRDRLSVTTTAVTTGRRWEIVPDICWYPTMLVHTNVSRLRVTGCRSR